MELNRDQLLEIIDANGGSLDASKIPINTIPEDIKIPGTLKVATNGRLRHIPAIKVGTLLIESSIGKIQYGVIVESGFQADYVDIRCACDIFFGDNIKIVKDLKISNSLRTVFCDNLFVGGKIYLSHRTSEVGFGQQLRVGDCISVAPGAGRIQISECSEIGFHYANSSEREHYPRLRAETIERLPAHSKFYCHVSGLAPGAQIDKDVFIAGNLYWGHGNTEDKAGNLPILEHALHIDGCLCLSGTGAEFLIPDGSQIGELSICIRDGEDPIHLRLGDGIAITEWPSYCVLDSIPSQFKTEACFCCEDASSIRDVAADAYFGSHVTMQKCSLEHWPIKHHRGDLDLSCSKVRTLEPGAVIEGDLVLDYSNIEELINVKVEGSLHIEGCSHLHSLQGTTIKEEIHIGGATPIQALQPENIASCTRLHWYFGSNNDLDSLASLVETLQKRKGARPSEDTCVSFEF